MNRTLDIRVLAAVALLASSCAMATDVSDHEEVDSLGQAIWNGIPLPEADSGLVNVGGCSGTLMRNNWILTAAHCVKLYLDRDFANSIDGVHAGTSSGVTLTSGVVDASGRLVIAGGIFVNNAYQFHLERFTADGILDPTFGNNGKVNFDFLGSSSEAARAVAIQSDGKIVAAGFASFGPTLMFALARFNYDGAPDTSFGFLGASQTDFSTSLNEQAFGLAIDSRDRAVAVGISGSDFAVARFNGSGNLDTSFNRTGLVTTDLAGAGEQASAVAIDANGKIVVVGTAGNGMGVARYNDDGTPDTSIGNGGKRVVSGGFYPRAVLTQGTKIILGAQTPQLQPALFRLNADGSSDPTFGTSGVSRPTFAAQTGGVVGLAFAPGGAIRVGAALTSGTSEQFMGYSLTSASGKLTPDRFYPELSGNTIKIGSGIAVAALAAKDTRVFMIGSQTLRLDPNLSTAFFMVLQPERTEDTTFTNGMTVEMADDRMTPDRAYLVPNGEDAAMLHLPMGMKMNGQRTGYVFPGFIADPNSVRNTTVICKGYGASVINLDGSVAFPGTLRGGFLNVSDVADRYITVVPLPQPNLQNLILPGDSGGNCSVAAGGTYVGLNARGGAALVGGVGSLLNPNLFATWAMQKAQTP